MYSTISALLNRLDSRTIAGTGVIKWGCPVPICGDPASARIATVGINPSNREFVDERGNELAGRSRRFHTLNSLGLSTWAEADCRHIEQITDSCTQYFQRNPYNIWFKRLEHLVSAMRATFYGDAPSACHLDLVPYATTQKWTELSSVLMQLAFLSFEGFVCGRLWTRRWMPKFSTGVRSPYISNHSPASLFGPNMQAAGPSIDDQVPISTGSPIRRPLTQCQAWILDDVF